ncbi:hypothetical protein CANARDRAFT_6243 [[Candida] arabinofermentans NRRL YB-2248]|uniref:PPM-type phosphatase domain-containing protein n=1 Tax=[Candida] arabinofermentans NRRL YB-2248 TaxID=983967 RepID=A0A1E4T4I2_9ASCO|nr:hypothetical protein CANARDRAFT_6243 [[Candida] arabinofermentans NRRL YB-2248]
MSRYLSRIVPFNHNTLKPLAITRSLSQHLSIVSTNDADSHLRFNVNMTKVPSNYGYYSSRVNRLYNEDRVQVGILDIDFTQLDVPASDDNDKDTNNKELDSRINDITEPKYTNDFKYTKVFNFSVFDGHGGDECSSYCSDHLLENIEKFKITQQSINDLFKFYQIKIGGYWRRWIKRQLNHFIQILNIPTNTNIDINNKKLWELQESNSELFSMVKGFDFFRFKVFMSFLYTDSQFLRYEDYYNNSLTDSDSHLINSGSTCTSAFIYTIEKQENDPNGLFYQDNTLSRLLIAHLGDTRAILCDNQGLAHCLTNDHHPSNPIESRRLTRFSSGLLMTDSFGEERFLNFANTRSFGDLTAKNIGVSGEPEFTELLIGDSKLMRKYKNKNLKYLKQQNIIDFGGDECFLVLLSDGVTNYLSDQEVVDLVTSTTNNKGALRGTPGEAAKEVIQFVECIGGDDNATCSIVKLNGWGKWPNMDRTGHLREEKMMGNTRRGR